MPKTFRYEFDDLPLVIEAGFEAGQIAGHAEISYTRDGSWNIEAIRLDGHTRLRWSLADHAANASKPPLPIFERKVVELDAGTPLYLTIYHRLEHEWRDHVQDAVIEKIAEDRECAADDAADARREELMLMRGA